MSSKEPDPYLSEEVELRVRGKRVHVIAALGVLATAGHELDGPMSPAGDLAESIAYQARTLDDLKGDFHSMVADAGASWMHDDPNEALDVDLISFATDGGVTEEEFFVVDEQRAAVTAGPFESQEEAAEEASHPDEVIATRGVLDMMAASAGKTLRWENDDDGVDVLTDGGLPAEIDQLRHAVSNIEATRYVIDAEKRPDQDAALAKVEYQLRGVLHELEQEHDVRKAFGVTD
jgi:hypothetical protein